MNPLNYNLHGTIVNNADMAPWPRNPVDRWNRITRLIFGEVLLDVPKWVLGNRTPNIALRVTRIR